MADPDPGVDIGEHVFNCDWQQVYRGDRGHYIQLLTRPLAARLQLAGALRVCAGLLGPPQNPLKPSWESLILAGAFG